MARAKTSDQVKDWERQRKEAEEARRRTREVTNVGERLREVKAEKAVHFEAVGPTGRVVRAGPLTSQQRVSLTRIFEADGYTVQ